MYFSGDTKIQLYLRNTIVSQNTKVFRLIQAILL
nr:MAG TPA: hypothetical protein [Bacteriophage sp.]